MTKPCKLKKLEKMLYRARRQYVKSEDLEAEIYRYIDENFEIGDLDFIYANGVNCDNLNEMISCFLSYGENCPYEIAKTIKEILKKKQKEAE